MSDTEKNIPFRILNDKPVGAFLPYKCPTIALTFLISKTNLDNLISALKKHTPTMESCFHAIKIQCINSTTLDVFAPYKPTQEVYIKYRWNPISLDKSSCPNMKYALSDYNKTLNCWLNLEKGKCRDEFIRRTLGAALFPEFYAKVKQK